MLNFLTLFDKNYASRGIALYNSLEEYCENPFCLYLLAMDSETAEYFNSLKRDNLVVITVSDMKEMYPVLDRLEKERTRGEFSWTLSSFSIQYCLKKYNLESCTYIDSDVCFFNDPEILLNEIGEKSVLITEHNYTPKYDQTETSGKYCVQFMYFKNNEDGNKVLEWWRKSCEDWCYNRHEDGKFGDQKYLDDWESRFEGIVYNCRNIGCGVAPWNIQKFNIYEKEGITFVQDKITKLEKPLVFFHFHALKKISDNGDWCLSQYFLEEESKEFFKIYLNLLKEIELKLPGVFISKSVNIKISLYEKFKLFLWSLLRFLPRYLRERDFSQNNIVKV